MAGASVIQRSGNLLAQVRADLARPNPDLGKVNAALTQLKIAITELDFMQVDRATTADVAELQFAREVLELAATASLHARDLSVFERYMNQLKTYYYNYHDKLPASERQWTLLGLNLLRLLSQNRIAEFHTELELLPPSALENRFIRHPVQVEQWLMEGAYNKVIKGRTDLPAPEYAFIMDTLINTMRYEVADCCQAAYAALPIQTAAQLMFFPSVDAFLELAATVWFWGLPRVAAPSRKRRSWEIDQARGIVTFQAPAAQLARGDIPADDLIAQTLRYAVELERIV